MKAGWSLAAAATVVGVFVLGTANAHAAASAASQFGSGPFGGPWFSITEDFGAPDVVNDVTVTRVADTFSFVDPGEITLRGTSSCQQVSPTEVNCPAPADFLTAALAGASDRLVLPASTGFRAAQIKLGLGDDFFQGGDEEDDVTGDAGDDEIRLGAGNDSGRGFSGAGALGGPGADAIFGEAGDDVIYGDQSSQPASTPATGDDTLDGGDGNDRLEGDAGADVLTGGSGNDTVFDSPSSPLERGPEEPQSRDVLSGGDGDDLLRGGFGGDPIDGGPGNDTITASGGTALGGDGNDIVQVANGSYTAPGLTTPQFLGDPAVLDGGPGDDILQGVAATFDFPAEQASDQLICGDGDRDSVVPGAGDLAGVDCEFVYEIFTCGSATCEGSISIVAPQPPSGSKRPSAKGKLVLVDKSFTLRKGQRAKLAKVSQRAAKILLDNREAARVTKTVQLASDGGNQRKTKRTTIRYTLTK